MDTSYRTATNSNPPWLSDEHLRTLVSGSAISPEVIKERGIRSVRRGRGQLPSVYSRRQKQRAPGILFTVHRPNGETSTIFRPDEPDPANPGHKYEQPVKRLGGSGNVLDTHPSARHLVGDTSVPVIFTEGVKKGDAITSAARAEGIELLAISISGTWNWMSDGEPIPDMFDVPVEGRRTLICFDSDVARNPGVQMACEALARHLTQRGAELEIVLLPDLPDGAKRGVDDHLANGGTLEQLLALARPFEADLLQRAKLSRSEQLRRALAFVTRRELELPARTRRGCSKRAVWRTAVELAERRGKLVEDGIEVPIPILSGAEMAAVGKSTVAACLGDLVEDGLMRRIRRKRSEHADSYILLVPGGVFRGNEGRGEKSERGRNEDREREDVPGFRVIPPLDPVPEMRWSSPGRKPRRGLVEGTRRVRQGSSLASEILGKRRPGKKRAEILRYLCENGGEATRQELLEAFGGERTQWRDFKRQTLAPLLGRQRQYNGQPLSVGPAVIALTDEGIRMVDGWDAALEQHRRIGEEQAAADEQQRRHLEQRIAFRRRNEIQPDHHPANAEGGPADGWVEELERLPEPPDARELLRLIGHRVETVRGPGELWDIKGNEARVVLDADPSRWVPLDPAELLLLRDPALR